MIIIENKKDCCGCSACSEICPKKCISFNEDKEGFRYPNVDLDVCINCGLCEKVCPVTNDSESQKIVSVFAASIKNEEIRRESSSGGVFSYLAIQTINEGGIVYGASYNNEWEVSHIGIEHIEDLRKLRSSKYMQSQIANSYIDVRANLQKGRKVLFSGTPCQIAGLKKFLRKEYENLLCVDFICHGVPSPKVWRKYLLELIQTGNIGPSVQNLKQVNFRSKVPNWLFFQILIDSSQGTYVCSKDKDPYFRAFNMNVTIRPICYNCPFKAGRSASDLTIADFWGIKNIDPDIYNDNGVSMIIDYGKNKFDLSELNLKSEDSKCIESCNGSFYNSAQYNDNRRVLFGKIDSAKSIIKLMERCVNPSFLQRIGNRLYRKLS